MANMQGGQEITLLSRNTINMVTVPSTWYQVRNPFFHESLRERSYRQILNTHLRGISIRIYLEGVFDVLFLVSFLRFSHRLGPMGPRAHRSFSRRSLLFRSDPIRFRIDPESMLHRFGIDFVLNCIDVVLNLIYVC